MKPRYKRRFFWTSVILFATAALSVVIVPPMITLDGLKPKLHDVILATTGIETKINGSVHFSLLGGATIIAHDVDTPYGNIGSAMFTVPLTSVFDLENTKLGNEITIYNADIKLTSLRATSFNRPIEIYNSTARFHNKDYEIIRMNIDGADVNGTVRTNDHKYDIKTHESEFVITNKNNNLEIIGTLYDGGGARGKISIKTDSLNRFFEFSTPRIPGHIAASAAFDWNGGTGIDFTNITSDNFSGNVEIKPDGKNLIQITSPNIDYDFSYLANPSNLFTTSDLNLDLYGNLRFGNRTFNHLKVIAASNPGKFKIDTIVADDIKIAGGYIDGDGAHNIMITMPYNDTTAMCIFSGTPDNWRCSAFSTRAFTGSLSVSKSAFDVIIQSNNAMSDINQFLKKFKRFGATGRVHFAFANMAGTADITPRDTKITYTFANNKTLSDMGFDLKFIPDFMRTARGNFMQSAGATVFTPSSGKWNIIFQGKSFIINGDGFKAWLPGIDLQSVRDGQYTVSGNYSGDTISDLLIQVAGMEFSGRAVGNTITLHTDTLNIDSIANPDFVARYSELEFLTTHPIVLPFNLPVKISMDARRLIYNGIAFSNFVYSLKEGTQTFSITDQDRGNMLATISHDKTNYDIFVQLNRFVANGDVLSPTMPLNIRDTMITAEIKMRTSGHTAHDLIYNLMGDMDLTFEGGHVIGLGLDNFFAASDSLSGFNVEYALSDALSAGQTRLKKMHIVGKYENGNFITSRPFTLQMPHTDATGEMDINDGKMMVMLNMTMRGTAPEPQPINMRILPDGSRDFSLSDIMKNFDAGFMRAFIKTHDKF